MRPIMIAYILALALTANPAAISSQDIQAIKSVTKRFLAAMIASDRETLRALVPVRTENRYGRCPLTAMPSFDKVVVDAHRAGVYFSGGHNEPGLPQKGLFIMVRVEEDEQWPWKVRTIVWYTETPRSVRLPSRSVTKQDAAQEPEVRRAATAFISAWRERNFALLERMSYRWVEKSKPKKRRRVSVSRVNLSATPTGDGEARVHFTAKLHVLGFIPYKVDGFLYAVKEEGEWKVRENSFAF